MAKNLGAEAKGATQQAAEAILKGGGSQPIITVSDILYSLFNIQNNYFIIKLCILITSSTLFYCQWI